MSVVVGAPNLMSIMNMHPQGGVASRDQRPNADVDVSKLPLDVCLGTTEQ